MPTKTDLENAFIEVINDLQNDIFLPDLKRQKVDAAYEAYIFSLILRAIDTFADRSNGQPAIRIKNINGNSNNIFTVRGGPGEIYGNSSNYSYAEFTYKDVEYEVHIDVQFAGTSTVKHEVDVSIIDKCKAENYRNEGQTAKSVSLRSAFECKFYSSSLEKHLIRAFVGLLDDMGKLELSAFTSNLFSQDIDTYCTSKKRPYFMGRLIPGNREVDEFILLLKIQLSRFL